MAAENAVDSTQNRQYIAFRAANFVFLGQHEISEKFRVGLYVYPTTRNIFCAKTENNGF
jgi:hypothetical protein